MKPVGGGSLYMCTYVYRNEDHGTGQGSVSLPGSCPDVAEAMVLAVCPTFILVCVGGGSLHMYTYVYRNEDHGTGQGSVSHPALPGSSPDVGEAMVLAVCPTHLLVCLSTYITLVDLILCLCVPCTMLVDLILFYALWVPL